MSRSTLRLGRRIRGRAAALIAIAALIGSAIPAPMVGLVPIARAAGNLPSGFTDEVLASGLNHPTVVSVAPDGRVFVAEKRGVVKTWDTYASFVNNDTPTITIDIQIQVFDYWDRGLLGMTVDPAWPAAGHRNIYLLYTADARPGDTPPHWQTDPGSSASCPNPPGGAIEGCVATGRLDKVAVDPTTGVASARVTLVNDWCQQFPSHSIGTVAFGADGMLYVGAGEGANFNASDWGQFGGTKPDTSSPVTPANPCGDPVDASQIPPAMNPPGFDPGAQGGALRAQSFRGSMSLASMDGAIIRIDPQTGLPAAGNPVSSGDLNRQRIVAYGFRNPFRFTVRPGTNDLWIGDVGDVTWEELDRLPVPTAGGGPSNYGWPCFEALDQGNYYGSSSLSFCSSLSFGSTVPPVWTYNHSAHMATGDGCATGSSSVSGLAFYTGSGYPASFDNGLFVADYSRNCIVFIPAGGNGLPDPTAVIPFESGASGPVGLYAAPNGDILYPELSPFDSAGGAIHRIRYLAPTAAFTATPSSGNAPLHVVFDASGSTSQVGSLRYVWNFGDGGGDTAPSSSSDATHDFNAGTFSVRLTVTDQNGATSQVTHQVASSNSPPTVTIDSPSSSLTWKVGDTISVAGHATDPQDGTLPGSALSWTVVQDHCPLSQPCHQHLLTSFIGSAFTFAAENHDYPTHLHITVTATDSVALSSSAEVVVDPQTVDVTIGTQPVPLPISLDGSSGPVVTSIVGSLPQAQAMPVVAVGENTYRFSSWSDGGAITHGYLVPATTPPPLIATYTQDTDAPDTCGAAGIQTSVGAWWAGTIGQPSDVDWFRFKLTKSGYNRFVLGTLPVTASLALYKGCSTLLASVDRPGTTFEEIYRSLPAGTYALRVTGGPTADRINQYHLRVQPLGTSMRILSSKSVITGSTLRIVGEVFNATSSRRGPVTVTARLWSASGHLLATRSTIVVRSILRSGSLAPFIISGSVPRGYSRATISVTSDPVTGAQPFGPAVSGLTSVAAGGGGWLVHGTLTNTTSSTMRTVRVAVTLYDSLGNVFAVAYLTPARTTLTRGRSTTFSVTFAAGPPPSNVRTTTRASH